MEGSGSAADCVEIEWQFDALDLRPVERWLATLPEHAGRALTVPVLTVRAKPPRRLVDRYLDTEDWRMRRGGFVLRVRRRGRHQEVTLKDTRPPSEGGLRQRLELTEDLPPNGLAGLGPDGPVGRRVAALTGNRPLRELFEVRTRRQPFALEAAAGEGEVAEVAEVALDDTAVSVGPGQRPTHLRRVEVEVVPDRTDALRPVVEELRSVLDLRPAALSKFEAGLLAAGLEVPGPPDLGPTEVGRDATLGELAFAVLRTHLAVLLAKEPGTRLGDDPEELHDMRVATRRLRAAMDLFADALPARAPHLREELRWIADALGHVRDLDVQIERVEQMATWSGQWVEGQGDAFAELRRLLESERSAARRELLADFDSARWERLTTGLVALARRGPERRVPATLAPAALVTGDLVMARHRQAEKAARRARKTGAAPDFHKVRIRCKALRYSLEFTAPLFGAPARRFTRKLARLQDELGLLQDAEVGRARLRALATAPGAGLPPATVFAMGAVAEHYRVESEDRRAAMPARLDALTGRTWKNLASAVERRQSRALRAADRTGRAAVGPAPVVTPAEGVTPATALGRATGDGDHRATAGNGPAAGHRATGPAGATSGTAPAAGAG